MTTEAGEVLLGQIAPRLRSAIPKCVQPVGAEDSEELVQDAIVVAAKMLHNVEQAGKKVTPGNIAYYTILHMKSGRRSQCGSRTDVMACGTQLDQMSAVMSLEDEVGFDPELDEPITLGSLLADEREDPSTISARNIDWEQFLSAHDYRYGVVVLGIIEGQNLSETARSSGLGYWLLTRLSQKLADDVREFMGDEAVMDTLKVPTWRANLKTDRDRAACVADRRRW